MSRQNVLMPKTVLAAAAAFTLAGLSAAPLAASTVYDALPNPAPGNVVSLGYQATATAEFGEHVVLGGTDRELTGVTFGLSSWAKKSDYPLVGDLDSFSHPLTVNLYSVDDSGATPAVGSLLASKTVTADVPYRPEVFGFNGIYFTTGFDFSADNVTLPEEVIVTLAYNTQTYGANPTGVAGPYNSLNQGLNQGEPVVGADAEGDAMFWNSTFGGRAAGLSRDVAWEPYTSTVAITAVPEPAGFGLLALTGIALLLRRRRR